MYIYVYIYIYIYMLNGHGWFLGYLKTFINYTHRQTTKRSLHTQKQNNVRIFFHSDTCISNMQPPTKGDPRLQDGGRG
jgi:hypothetical protein